MPYRYSWLSFQFSTDHFSISFSSIWGGTRWFDSPISYAYASGTTYSLMANLATVSGNFDHWNIDYVKLDEYHNSSDTSFLNDVAFVRW